MPKFPDLLLNNNPNAPSIDLNDLQVKGVGIFADKAERDLLDANIQTEGYLAIMKDDDNLYVYIGGGWTTATNWVRVSGTLQVAEVDGSPIGDVSVLAFPPSTLTITGPVATVNLSGYATAVQLAALQTEVDNIETALGIEITGIAPPTDPGDILISDGTNFGVSVYSLPTTDGSAGQFLQTDGLGNVSFATISATLEGLTDTPVGYGTAGQVLITNGVDGFTFGSGSPWVTDTNGINYQAGNVGIGVASTSTDALAVAGSTYINNGGLIVSDSVYSYAAVSPGVMTLQDANASIRIQSTAAIGGGNAYPYSIGIGSSLTLSTITGASNVILGRQISGTGVITQAVCIGYNKSAETNSVDIGNGGAGSVRIKGSSTGGNSVAIHATAGSYAVGIGSGAVAGANAVAIGHPAQAGTSGTSVGIRAGQSSTGTLNTNIGGFTGYSGASPKSYSYATLVGAYAGQGITTGDYNTAVGYQAGSLVATGSSNVFLGYQAGYNETGSNKLYISNSNTTTPLIYGEFDNTVLRVNGTFQINDPAGTGYAFPAATGTLDQVLKVDANGDLVFAAGSSTGGDISLDTTNFNSNLSAADTTVQLAMDTLDDLITGQWTIDTNGINYQAGNVGIGAASSSSFDLNVGSGIILEAGQLLFSSVSDGIRLQSAFNTTAGVGIGYQAIPSGGPGSVSIGNQVRSPNSGTVVIGYSTQAMTGWTAADPKSVLIGHSAGMTATTAVDIIAIGNGPLGTLTSGEGNTAIGRQAGGAITTEFNNTFVGYEAGRLVTGEGNTFIGMQAGEVAVSMDNSTFIGLNAGRGASGSSAVAIGYNAGVSGSNAISILGSATGTESIAIGGDSQVLAARGLAIGFEAHAKTGQDLVIGNRTNKYSFEAASTGNNVLIGHSDRSVLGPNNVMLGNSFVLNRGSTGMGTTPPTRNVAVGHSHFNNDPANVNSNIAIGGTLFNAQDGAEIAYNVVLSYDMGGSDGGLNQQGTALRNVVIGYQAGHAYDLGSDNVLIGYQAGRNETGSNKLYISNSNTATPLIYGEFDNNIVKINGTYSGGAIGFFPANGNTNDTIAIGDQDYLAAGGVTTNKGLSIMFDSTISVVDYQSGLIIGRNLNIAQLKNDQLILGNRVVAATVSQAPKIIIGNGIDYEAGNNNHAGAILIGANPACEMGDGIQIGGSGTNFNGVAIKSTGAVTSQGGVAIMGQAGAYDVIIGASTYAGTSGSSSQKVVIGNGAGVSSSAQIAIGAGAGSNKTGDYNTAIGQAAYADNTSTGTGNTIIGKYAGKVLTTASNNTMIGARAALNMTTGSSNVVIGGGLGSGGGSPMQAMTNGSGNIVLGSNALVTATTASYNIIAGLDAGANVGGNGNLILGYRSAYLGTADDTGITNNVVLGYQAGYSLADTGNVFIGEGAGYNATGAGNVMIGTRAGFSETGSNKLYISSGQGNDLIYGEFDNRLVRVDGNLQRMIFGGTETTTSGTIHIRNNTNWATQADATNNTASTGLLGIAQGSQANAGLILFGDVDYTIVGNVGDPVYLNTTAGGFTTTAPTASGNIVRVMGYIIGSNKIFFNPSNDWLEII